MSQPSPKRRRIRLEVEEYAALRKQVLQRDGWRCQFCGLLDAVEVHHVRFRSHRGEDSDQNLITLCCTCHRAIHAPNSP